MADENHAPEIVLALSPRAVQPHTLAGTRGAVIDLSGGGGTPCANGHAQHSPAPIGLAHPPAQPPPQHGARLGKMDASSGRSPPSVPALADGELSIDLSATRTPRPLSVRVDDTQRQPPANVSGHREGPSQSPSPPRERRHVRSCRDALATVRSLGLLITALLLTTAWFVHGAVGDILVTMRPTDGPDSATWPAAAPHAAAPPSPPDAPGGPVVAWKLQPASCTFNDFVSLVSCRHGYARAAAARRARACACGRAPVAIVAVGSRRGKGCRWPICASASRARARAHPSASPGRAYPALTRFLFWRGLLPKLVANLRLCFARACA